MSPLRVHIGEQLHNHFTCIILRTGQPGYATEEKVILEYEISDYANKTELSRQKLMTITTANLRSYANIDILFYLKNKMIKIIEYRS